MNKELIERYKRRGTVTWMRQFGQVHYNACRFELAKKWWVLANKLERIIKEAL